MSDNSFGKLFRVTTWGESHGPAIGCVIDGCPPGILLRAEMIQAELDTRKPGTSKYVTQRREPDQVEILSGVFEDEDTDGPRTTGTPISLMITNQDQRSKDYGEIKNSYRPGHADFSYDAKYGIRDYRGGGRSSARETAMRVAAGAVAAKVLKQLLPDYQAMAGMVQMGAHKVQRDGLDWAEVAHNPLNCPHTATASAWATELEAIRKDGSSVGAVIEVVAQNVPAGLGAPIYNKLDTDLANAMMSINAVKGVEIGEGMNAAALTGPENADEMRMLDGQPHFTSNHAGGIMGGISTGQDIVVRFAVKPTSSILHPRKSITKDGQHTDIITKGRHDPCVGIRAVPVGLAMMHCVILDQFLLHRGQIG